MINGGEALIHMSDKDGVGERNNKIDEAINLELLEDTAQRGSICEGLHTQKMLVSHKIQNLNEHNPSKIGMGILTEAIHPKVTNLADSDHLPQDGLKHQVVVVVPEKPQIRHKLSLPKLRKVTEVEIGRGEEGNENPTLLTDPVILILLEVLYSFGIMGFIETLIVDDGEVRFGTIWIGGTSLGMCTLSRRHS
ncbi:hypothetical protein V6N13_001084 [Hibiscus sabdariffa]